MTTRCFFPVFGAVAIAAFTAILIVAARTALPEETPAAGELLANPGFELEGPDGKGIDSWFNYSLESTIHYELDETVKRSGRHSLKMWCDDSDDTQKTPNATIQHLYGREKWIGRTALTLRAFIRGKDTVSAGVFARFDSSTGEALSVASSTFSTPLSGSFDWRKVSVVATIPPAAASINVICYSQGGAVWFDDVSAKFGVDIPSGNTGLYYVEYAGTFKPAREGPAKISFAVPIVTETQVPLALSVSTEPAEALDTATIVETRGQNAVLEIGLKSMSPKKEITVRWRSVVFLAATGEHPPEPDIALRRKYLTPTVSVQSESDPVKDAAEQAVIGREGALDTVSGITLYAATKIKQTPYIPSTDAQAALLIGGRGCCTSHANVACALLRARGIPARILSVFPAGKERKMQMHFIVEAFVENEGWLRAETSAGIFPITPNAHIVTRIVDIEDENESTGRGRLWMASGVPYLASFEAKSGDFASYTCTIDKSMGADHISGEIAVFDDIPEDKIKETFELAKKYWAKVAEGISSPDARKNAAEVAEKIEAVRDIVSLRKVLIEAYLGND